MPGGIYDLSLTGLVIEWAMNFYILKVIECGGGGM